MGPHPMAAESAASPALVLSSETTNQPPETGPERSKTSEVLFGGYRTGALRIGCASVRSDWSLSVSAILHQLTKSFDLSSLFWVLYVGSADRQPSILWVRFVGLEAEKLAGVGVSNLGAVSVADGAAVEPGLSFNHVLVGIVDGIHHAVCTNFENHIGKGRGAKIAAGSDVEVFAQLEAERTLRLERETTAAYAIVDAPDAMGNGFA